MADDENAPQPELTNESGEHEEAEHVTTVHDELQPHSPVHDEPSAVESTELAQQSVHGEDVVREKSTHEAYHDAENQLAEEHEENQVAPPHDGDGMHEQPSTEHPETEAEELPTDTATSAEEIPLEGIPEGSNEELTVSGDAEKVAEEEMAVTDDATPPEVEVTEAGEEEHLEHGVVDSEGQGEGETHGESVMETTETTAEEGETTHKSTTDEEEKTETFSESEEVESALAPDDDTLLSSGQAGGMLERVDEEEGTAEDDRGSVTVVRGRFTPSGSFVNIAEDADMDRPRSPGEFIQPERDDRHLEFAEDDDEEREEVLGVEEPEPRRTTREQLIEKYHPWFDSLPIISVQSVALAERQQQQEQNYQLQHRLAEMFRTRRSDDIRADERSSTEQEKRYLNYMASLDTLHRQAVADGRLANDQISELSSICAEKQDEVNAERLRFVEFKKHIALAAVSNRSGRPLSQQEVEQLLSADEKKEVEVTEVRLENIKLKNKLRKQEARLKSKEELAEGLHLIDFEQLKIENQTYNEKIEERNEELQKLRRKITSTVQVLTHLKEKLQFIHGENVVEKDRLKDIEEHVARKRDALSRTKQVRDGLRIDNQRLNQNSGLLGNAMLLRDFEERYDDVEFFQRRLSQLKMSHADLTLNLNGLRQKIEASKVA